MVWRDSPRRLKASPDDRSSSRASRFPSVDGELVSVSLKRFYSRWRLRRAATPGQLLSPHPLLSQQQTAVSLPVNAPSAFDLDVNMSFHPQTPQSPSQLSPGISDPASSMNTSLTSITTLPTPAHSVNGSGSQPPDMSPTFPWATEPLRSASAPWTMPETECRRKPTSRLADLVLKTSTWTSARSTCFAKLVRLPSHPHPPDAAVPFSFHVTLGDV